MSRTFTNTIIFEQSLDAIPPASQDLYNWAQEIYNPNVKIVEEDCQTSLGEPLGLSTKLLGKLEVTTEQHIGLQRLVDLSNQGETSVNVRGIHTCIADGGVCRTCLIESRPWLFQWQPVTVGGSPTIIDSLFHLNGTYANSGRSGYTFVSSYSPDPIGLPFFDTCPNTNFGLGLKAQTFGINAGVPDMPGFSATDTFCLEALVYPITTTDLAPGDTCEFTLGWDNLSIRVRGSDAGWTTLLMDNSGEASLTSDYTIPYGSLSLPTTALSHLAVFQAGGQLKFAVNGVIVWTGPAVLDSFTPGFYFGFDTSSIAFSINVVELRIFHNATPYTTSVTVPTTPFSPTPAGSLGTLVGFEVVSGPDVNDFVSLPPAFVIQRDVIGVTAGSTSIPLSYSTDQFDHVNVYVDGVYWPEQFRTLSGSTITLTYPVILNPTSINGYSRSGPYVVIEYIVNTRAPFYYWLTNTYSGALLGTQGFPVDYLTIRKELHRQVLPAGAISDLVEEVVASPLVPEPVKKYIQSSTDPLEKAVLGTVIGGVFLVN